MKIAKIYNHIDTYYYHGDHLGSMSWITDGFGYIIEHRTYLPYGEEWYSYRATKKYTERFTFTGKEKDAESGYDYFGARYFDVMLLTSWLSVDPLAGKYPYMNPYAYCENNPMKNVDPDGKRSQMVIKGNTMTISAKYYTLPSNYESAKQAVSFWNEQKGLTYTDQDGNKFVVKFNLSAHSSLNPDKEVKNNTDGLSNAYHVVSELNNQNENSTAVGGTNSDGNRIEVLTGKSNDRKVGAHEIGHTLMNGNKEVNQHSSSGIMTANTKDPKHGVSVSQETVNTIVESQPKTNKSIWQRIKSILE